MKKQTTLLTASALMLALSFTTISSALSQTNDTGTPILGATKLNDAVMSSENDSYGWCMQMFEQDAGDYLWLGANRDLGGLIALSSAQDIQTAIFMVQAFGLTFDPQDQAGKIYRMALEGENQSWELMYENPVINGWRKMVVFKGDLYVFAGITNRINFVTGQPIPANNWSAIFRFGSDFKYGDEPEIVLWENLPGSMVEYYRSGTVTKNAQGQDEYLYIGTASSKIWRTDGTGLENLTPAPGSTEKNTGWEQVVDLIDEGYIDVINSGSVTALGVAMVWDLIDFNGSIYAFIAGSADGFEAFKLTPQGNAYNIKQIVGGSGDYQQGLGITQHVAASPFKATMEGKDYIYVTTFANGPRFLASLIQMDFIGAFRDLYMPAALYRFDASDNWEVVVGDPGMALANDGSAVAFANGADQRAGFFPGNSVFTNSSSNQYIWWMEQHEGKLYASTWDMGNFREPLAWALDYIASTVADGDLSDAVADVYTATTNLITEVITTVTGIADLAAEVLENIQEDLALLIGDIEQILESGSMEDLIALLQGFVQTLVETIQEVADEQGLDLENLFDMEAVTDFVETIGNFTEVVTDLEEEEIQLALFILASRIASASYINDNSNPVGFDLFESEDGVTWKPVTVAGFGNETNYGGRVILSTDYGLFLSSANPFTGFEIFRVEEFTPEMEAPVAPTATVALHVGDTYKFQVQTVFENAMPTIEINQSGINVSSEVISEETSPNVYVSIVEIVPDITVYGGNRLVETELTTRIHEISLTFTEVFTGDVIVTIAAGEMEVHFGFDVSVTESANIRDSELATGNILMLYPNPVTHGVFFVTAHGISRRIEVYDLTGRLVHTQSATEDKTEVNISHLPDGMYIVNVGQSSARILKQ